MASLDPTDRTAFWTRPKFRSRLVSSLVAIGAVFAIVASPGWLISGYLVGISIAGSLELFTMLEALGVMPARKTALALSTGILGLTPWFGTRFHLAYLAFSVVAIATVLVLRGSRWSRGAATPPEAHEGEPTRSALASTADASSSLLSVIMLGWLPSHIALLRDLQPLDPTWFAHGLPLGMVVIAAYFACIIGTDIGAYLVGMSWGRHPLVGALSPKKSIEGAVGGSLVAVLLVLGIASLAHMPLIPMAGFAFAVSLTAQIGDLFESLIKRDAGFKDSGAMIPGHGGVLDRVDSYLLSAAIAYHHLTLIMPIAQPR